MNEVEGVRGTGYLPRGYISTGPSALVTIEQKNVAEYMGRVVAAQLAARIAPLIDAAVAQVIAAMREAEAAPASETPPPSA